VATDIPAGGDEIMTNSRINQIREILKAVAVLAGNPPPPEDGPDELIVHCWNIYELVDQLQELTGATMTLRVD
jgi:hypothetical protein